jgi:MFS family permease
MEVLMQTHSTEWNTRSGGTPERSILVFLVIWFGQVISTLGSGLTGFALSIWAYQTTGLASAAALIALAGALARLSAAPITGWLSDRLDRRIAMILGDSGAALGTVVLLVLLAANRLEPWHLALITAWEAACSTLQIPAYFAALPGLLPEKWLSRGNGMIQLGRALAEILAPMLAGAMVSQAGLASVAWVDLATFLFAVSTAAVVRFPALPFSNKKQTTSFTKDDLLAGWCWIQNHTGLKELLLFTTTQNFLRSMFGVLVVPMVLGFTSSAGLGKLVSLAGFGMLAGGLWMSAWGGPRRKTLGVLGFELFGGFCFILMGARPVWGLTALGAVLVHLSLSVIGGCEQTLWQRNTPEALHGRVLAFQQAVGQAAVPLALLIAGPLADGWFIPWMQPGGWLANVFGKWIGVGDGRGIALMFLLIGILKIVYSGATLLRAPKWELDTESEATNP